jgi:hypothetical protein
MKHYSRGRYAVFEKDVQTVRCQFLDSDVKSPLIYGHVMCVANLELKMLVGRFDDERPHASDSAVTHKLWSFQIAGNEGGCV